jgi:hypothetical protein
LALRCTEAQGVAFLRAICERDLEGIHLQERKRVGTPLLILTNIQRPSIVELIGPHRPHQCKAHRQ